MQYLLGIIVNWSIVATTSYDLSFVSDTENGFQDYCNILIEDIYAERAFDAMLIILNASTKSTKDLMTGGLYQQENIPKVIMTNKAESLRYKQRFNEDILLIIFLNEDKELNLIDLAAYTTDYMRQTRILIIAEYVRDKEKLLKLCQHYKMTNVLMLLYSTAAEGLLQLQPYPDYHWQKFHFNSSSQLLYYPPHWRNMKNRTLLTFTDQTLPRALVFADPTTGQLKLNGFLPRMVMLFAELYNASLKMSHPLVLGHKTHYTIINQMVDQNLIDIPMVMDSVANGHCLNLSDTFAIDQGFLMIPCAQPRSIREVYIILLSGTFICFVIICISSLSFVHTLCEYVNDQRWNFINFIINDCIVPGFLGLSFSTRSISLFSLKLVYLLLFFGGLYTSTQFSANIGSLFTIPSYHRKVETVDELRQSPLRILMFDKEAEGVISRRENLRDSIIASPNLSYVQETCLNFNNSFGYYTLGTAWRIFSREQQYYTHKVFCTPNGLIVFRFIPCNIRLQHNSPYKEPLNYLIHRVHELGLIDAWHSSLFSDMLKLDLISLRDPHPKRKFQQMTVNDLFWIWLIVVIGLALSLVVFFIELMLYNFRNRKTK
uniref:Ionotropic glutamate receptor C-terminal domain-containing protein n=1 Tax=Stomoxys calcitrans TaxID=35570 RepID=A0A1I8P5K9_STOCA